MPGREETASRGQGQGQHGHRRKNLKHRFEIIKSLGQGAYGKVKLAIERETGQAYAIKSIRKKNIGSAQDLSRLRREIEIMASLSHPHIIAIYEVFENADKIVLIMEYASGGELYDYCNDKQGLYDEEARKFFRQIVSAVHYLHMNGIVHRDLKLENIVLDIHGNAKIADFGFANIYGDEKLLSTFCGSPLYASPEIVNGLPYSGPEVDCWSLGVLLYAMVYGAMPFDGSDFKRLRNQITAGDYFRPNRPSDALDVIGKLLYPNPNRRATIDEIARAPWLNYGYDYNPIEDTLPGKPVDQDKLMRKISESSSSESDCDALHNSPVSPKNDHIPSTVNKQSSQAVSSPSPAQCKESKDISSSPPTIKGILKKPRDEGKVLDKNAVGYKRSRSMDLDLITTVPLRSKPSSQNKKPQRPLSSHVPTLVFDSSKKPKKGILKNSRPLYEGADSGCIMNDSSEEHSPLRSEPEPVKVSLPSVPVTPLKTTSQDESQNDEGDEASYDLDDIEAVLGNLLLETATICNMEKMLEQSPGVSRSVPDQTSGDSGIVDESSCDSSSVFNVSVKQTSVTSDSVDFSLEQTEISDSAVLTSTPNTHALTSSRRKRSAGKHKSKYSDPTWRYSTGSQGSTSSGDHLDFSYDSADGDGVLSEYFSMPLSPPPVFETSGIAPTPEDKSYQNIDLEVMKLPCIQSELKQDDDDSGPPPPLPLQPPPDITQKDYDSTTEVSLPSRYSPFDISYNSDDIMEQILWLEKQEADRIAAEEKSAKFDWDEVEDIYQQALKLQKEWS